MATPLQGTEEEPRWRCHRKTQISGCRWRHQHSHHPPRVWFALPIGQPCPTSSDPCAISQSPAPWEQNLDAIKAVEGVESEMGEIGAGRE